jgi:DNA-binding LytR/AlgR family response regulator
MALAIERLKSKMATPPPDLAALLSRLARKLEPARERLKWIKATVGQNLRLIPVSDVLYFQSDEKYTRVVTDEGEALIKTPIREILEGLDPEAFWQIHRSTVVNAAAISAVTRDFRGQAHVKVRGRDGSLVVSRIYSHLFKQM